MADDTYKHPVIQTPSIPKLREIASKLGMDSVSEQDLNDYQSHIHELAKRYDVLFKYPEPTLPVKYPRTPGYRPAAMENKCNAWYYKVDLRGESEGLLAGKKVAIKDNIPVAGVPMMNGNSLLQGYIPDFDATVITRILDHGGHILGKAVCESLCFSGASSTSATGPVLNPHDPTRTAGGSSSGSAVLVSLGEVDMALGGDQGGSIRIPSCWCGVVGLKPTWSLVPFTGIAGMEPSVDHVGPIARTVRDCALLLQAIAGYDQGLDFRQQRDTKVPKYSELLTDKLEGVKVGILEEGFEDCEPSVAEVVKAAAKLMTKAGAIVEDTSIPMFKDGEAIWTPIILEGVYMGTVQAAGCSVGSKGFHPTSLITNAHRGLKSETNDLPITMKLVLLMGEFIKEKYGMRHYSRAQNLNRLLVSEIDKGLQEYDVLIVPTIKFQAPKLPPTTSSTPELLTHHLNMVTNTALFDVTGHPVLSINAGFSGGLPVGMSIIGKHFDDATVLRVAYAYEQLRDAAMRMATKK